MTYRPKKDAVVCIIKQKGDCYGVACTDCPLDLTRRGCSSSFEGLYKAAIDYYIKKYGKEELMELLI